MENKVQQFIENKEVQEVLNALDYIEYDFDSIEKEEYSGEKELIDGRTEKRFLRVGSKCFEKLISELQNNPNCSYLTHANEAIKEGIIPSHISALVKKESASSISNLPIVGFAVSEVIASQILNFYECPTAFNTVCVDKMDKDEDRDEVCKIVSADFISSDEEFYSFADLGLYNWHGIENIVHKNKELLDNYKGYSEENKNKVSDDYVLSYYVRKYLLLDTDFDSRNIGLLVNSKEKTLKNINYDFEFACKFSAEFEFKDYVIHDSFEFFKNRFPKIYNHFVGKTKQIVEAEKDVLSKLKYKNKKHESAVRRVLENARYLLNQISIIEKFKYDYLLK